MLFFLRVPKFPQLGFMSFWTATIFCLDLRLKWGINQSCSPFQDISNSMSYATFTKGNMVDSWLLVVKSQIGNLIPDLSFGHTLCFRCPNGSCDPILDIYVSIDFQWYKEFCNAMGFDPCNRFLKIWESTETPTPKMGTHLGMWQFIPSHPLTFSGAWNVIVELPFWPTPLQALALVTSPRLGLQQPKV